MGKRVRGNFRRRVARTAAGVGGGLAVGLGALVAFVRFAPAPRHQVEAPRTLRVELTAERVAEGRRIATMFCAACHADPATGRLTGKRLEELPEAFGAFYSANITQDPEHGIGRYSDGELAFLLRTGIKRDGRLAVPMPTLAGIADDDVAALIAFLRSDDPLVAPAAVRQPPAQPTLMARALLRFQMKPAAWREGPATAPTHDPVAFGRYLAAARYDCHGCHMGTLAGGLELRDAAGRTVVSANLTPDPETGLPGLTEEGLARVLRRGFRADGRPVRAPMPLFSQLTDGEVHALYAYLRSVAPVRSAPRPVEAREVVVHDDPGAGVYAKYNCQACHGATGAGSCDLRPGAARFTSDADLIAFVKDPAAKRPGSRMPGWQGVIADDEYPLLAGYVRRLAAGTPVQVAER